MKKFNLKTLFFLFTALIISGCETIPPGTAPEGPIVKVTAISDRTPVSEKNAINAITTELITQPFIINSKSAPSLMFIPSVFDTNSPITSTYNSKFNNLTMKVYSSLFTSDLIIAPKSLKEYDYALLNGAHENPLFNKYKKGYKVFTWEVVIFSIDNQNAPIWTYSLNVLIPKITQKEIDQNTNTNKKIINEQLKNTSQKNDIVLKKNKANSKKTGNSKSSRKKPSTASSGSSASKPRSSGGTAIERQAQEMIKTEGAAANKLSNNIKKKTGALNEVLNALE